MTETTKPQESHMEGLEEISTHLEGDWTISTIPQRVDSLMEISQQQSDELLKGIVIHVDCSGIEKIDISGLQLLYVWLHCMDLKGFRTHLTNMSGVMRELLARMGLSSLFDLSHHQPEMA